EPPRKRSIWMVRLIGAPALALTLMTAASPAAFAHRYHHAGTGDRHVHHAGLSRVSYRYAHRAPFRSAARRVAGGRPRAWCGWYAGSLVGGDPGPSLNLARNWARWGHAARPGVGIMVVWAHHVGIITGRTAKGEWIVKSGNDGHAVRERPRSLAGAIAFRA